MIFLYALIAAALVYWVVKTNLPKEEQARGTLPEVVPVVEKDEFVPRDPSPSVVVDTHIAPKPVVSKKRTVKKNTAKKVAKKSPAKTKRK